MRFTKTRIRARALWPVHRAAAWRRYRHASAAGASVIEHEPDGKAAAEIRELYMWITAHVNMSTCAHEEV
jgi:hypothetical protein